MFKLLSTLYNIHFHGYLIHTYINISSLPVGSQSWSRRSSTMCVRCGSWRGCIDGGCRRRWCWRQAWFTPSSPVWTSCWSGTPASCRRCWTGGRRVWRRAAPPTSQSAGLETCCSDRYGSSGRSLCLDSLRLLMFRDDVNLKIQNVLIWRTEVRRHLKSSFRLFRPSIYLLNMWHEGVGLCGEKQLHLLHL